MKINFIGGMKMTHMSNFSIVMLVGYGIVLVGMLVVICSYLNEIRGLLSDIKRYLKGS